MFSFEDMHLSIIYYDLTTVVRRNKVIMFSFIREIALKIARVKVKKSIQWGWEVLIKSVIQVISSFAM